MSLCQGFPHLRLGARTTSLPEHWGTWLCRAAAAAVISIPNALLMCKHSSAADTLPGWIRNDAFYVQFGKLMFGWREGMMVGAVGISNEKYNLKL